LAVYVAVRPSSQVSVQKIQDVLYLTDVLFSFPLHPRCDGVLVDLKVVRKKGPADPFVGLDLCVAQRILQ